MSENTDQRFDNLSETALKEIVANKNFDNSVEDINLAAATLKKRRESKDAPAPENPQTEAGAQNVQTGAPTYSAPDLELLPEAGTPAPQNGEPPPQESKPFLSGCASNLLWIIAVLSISTCVKLAMRKQSTGPAYNGPTYSSSTPRPTPPDNWKIRKPGGTNISIELPGDPTRTFVPSPMPSVTLDTFALERGDGAIFLMRIKGKFRKDATIEGFAKIGEKNIRDQIPSATMVNTNVSDTKALMSGSGNSKGASFSLAGCYLMNRQGKGKDELWAIMVIADSDHSSEIDRIKASVTIDGFGENCN